MKFLKKLFNRRKKKAEEPKNKCWFNNGEEEARKRLWHNPDASGGYYDGAHHDQAVTNQIAKR